ncbi:sigma-70 family RNA polymerase sigma factor [Paenarthrobacter sp. NPDC089322]|uniref:sigma-70 family RNA polymerase sigma factor n=1 Tax=Paenarthrobacter sp. NPDC089322 TaxID=3155065 RepID=UPI0034130FEA
MVRTGNKDAFAELYHRHLPAAQYVARAQIDNPSDSDDVVAEAFASVFQALSQGRGPDKFFRAYLLTTVQRMAHDRNRKARRLQAAPDDAMLDFAVVDHDRVLNEFESSAMAAAFKSLPERWQIVLWHLDIEGMKPAAVATFLGVSANGVSSLAIRAREGLRQAYLQKHISRTPDDECFEYSSQLGKYARGALKRSTYEKVRAHMDNCSKCTALLIELNDIQSAMRVIIFPLVTGVVFTPAAVAGISSGPTMPQAASGTTAVRSFGEMWKIAAAAVAAVGLAVFSALMWLGQTSANTSAAEAPNAPLQKAAPSGTRPSSVPSPAAPFVPPVVPSPAPLDVPWAPATLVTSPSDLGPGVAVAPILALRGPASRDPLPRNYTSGGKAAQSPSPTPTGPAASPTPSPTPTGPAASPTPTPSPSPTPTGPGASPTPTPSPSPTPTGPAASPTPTGPAASPTPTPTPTPSPTAPAQAVEVTFGVRQGSGTTERVLSVGLSIDGQGSSGWAEADFTLSEGASFATDGFVPPAGWTCSDPAADIHRIHCTTQSMDPHGVTFDFGVLVPGEARRGKLDYGFTGQGFEGMTFTNEFS